MPSESLADATVATIGEHGLIARIRQRLTPAPDWLVVDIGDDAAVYEPVRNRLEVITTDAVVDGVHVDRRFVPAEAIGHRAVAVNLSDLAAMGATPRLLTLSLALPDELSVADFDRLVEGALALAERSGARLVGGNITRSRGPLVVDVTAIGSVHRRRILRRSGARAGDHIIVSGTLGDARAGLALLSGSAALDAELAPDAVARYLHPEPRLRLGQMLGRARAAVSAVDLSDGLADGLARLTTDHGLGCQIDATLLPISEGARAVWGARGVDAVAEAVAGGDDYELAFTVRPKDVRRLASVARAVDGLRLTRIGVVTRTPERWLVDAGRRSTPIGHGYEHFQPLMLAHSLWRKLALTFVVGGGVVWLYEVTVLDSRYAAAQGAHGDPSPPSPGARLLFSATAYCKGTTTASGVNVRSGIAAADPDLLPVGSVVQVDAPGGRYDGVYTVMDTGPKVQGRHLDVYMWSCHEALRFGRTAIRIVVLRLGWNPSHSAPGLVDSLFKRRETAARDAEPPHTPAAPSATDPTPQR